jgi:hypothetical protein
MLGSQHPKMVPSPQQHPSGDLYISFEASDEAVLAPVLAQVRQLHDQV